jgi:hypothetical protein
MDGIMSEQRLKATFPIHYSVSYKPYRAQNARYTHFPSEASVEFRAVPRSAVRTVMRAVSTRENDYERGWSFREPLAPKSDGSMREIVEFEGRLWIEAVPVAATIEGLESRSGKGTPFVERYGEKSFTVQTSPADQNAWSKPALMTSQEQIARFERATLSEFNDDKGEAMRAGLTRTADAMIAIDDMLYARFREPTLSVPAPADDRRAVTFVGAGDGAETYAAEGLRYAVAGYSSYSDGATRRWSLAEHATALAERKRAGGAPATPEVRFEVLDPEVLTACPHVAACLDLATGALKALWKNPMALRHGVIEHATELRDALSASRGQITPRLRRALDGVARIEPLSATDRAAWDRLAAGRPRMRTWNGHHHGGEDLPLTRASQVGAHAGDHAEAAGLASAALRRLAVRNMRLSWEERALEINAVAAGETTSYELLSSQAVAIHADRLGVDAREAIRAGRDDGARIFMTEDLVRKTGTYGPSSKPKRKGGKSKKDDSYEFFERVTGLLAVIDEAADGSLSVRSVLHGARKPPAAALALLDRHLAEAAPAPAPEPALAPGM